MRKSHQKQDELRLLQTLLDEKLPGQSGRSSLTRRQAILKVQLKKATEDDVDAAHLFTRLRDQRALHDDVVRQHGWRMAYGGVIEVEWGLDMEDVAGWIHASRNSHELVEALDRIETANASRRRR